MATKHGGLGRGLSALIKDASAPPPAAPTAVPAQERGSVLKVPVDKIQKSQWQPRRTFEKEALAELAQSIKEHGVLQPLLVRTAGAGYSLIAGERRLRAAIEAGLKEVPITVVTASDSDAMQLALVENLQRADLNVLEEAEGYQVLAAKFNMTQEQIASRVGKARASVTNTMRLLDLPAEVKQLLNTGELTPGHAKALLGLAIAQEQILYARRVIKENLSVRNLEKAIQKAVRVPRKPRASRDDIPPTHVAHLSDKLHQHFGTSIRLVSSRTLANGKKARGYLEVDFYSNDDLTRILDLMGIRED
jgi:ParB family chromosome partitioning protein